MTRNTVDHGSFVRLLRRRQLHVVGSVIFLICLTALGQTKPQIKKEKTPGGGTHTTKTWEEGDKQYLEETYENAKGKVTNTRKVVTGPEGKTGEMYTYTEDGETKLYYTTWKTDNTGKETEVVDESYNQGLLVKGEISVLKPGCKHLIVVKKWSNLHQQYDDIPKEDQDKEVKKWNEFDRRLEENERAREKFFKALREGKLKTNVSGTGETIGHVADVKLQNLTDQPLEVYLPPTVLESKDGAQDDFIPGGQDVALKPHETKTVPLDGTCLERDRPPAGRNDHDLVYDDVGEPGIDSHFSPSDVAQLIDIGRSTYDAVDQLQKDGAFDKFPYSDKHEQENIAVQWATWSNPDISDITGTPPANKDDFKRTIDKQIPKKTSRDERKKIDQGTDNMWDGIQLTGQKAKDLEKTEETPPSLPPGTYNVDNNTPTPAPQTTTKPKEKPKETPTPGKGEKVPMTTTKLLVDVLKGVTAKDDVTKPTQDDLKKDLKKAVADANKLLSNCGVQLDLAGADIVIDAPNPDTAGSENMDGNYDADKAHDIGKKAGEELKKAHGKETTGFKVYIVSEITNKTGSEQGVGYWYPKEGSTETDPGFVIIEASVAKDGRLLAHELGHGLGGLSDDNTKGNLMNPNPGKSDANNLTDDQCKKLKEGAQKRQ